MNPVVYSKFPPETISKTIDLTAEIPTGDTLASVTISSVFPVEPALVLTAGLASPSSLLFTAAGGQLNVTYGATLYALTTNGVTIPVQVILNVSESMDVKEPSLDPHAFVGVIGEIIAGDSAIGAANFMLPAGTDVSDGNVLWSLVDNQGVLHASGNCYDYLVDSTSFTTTVLAHGLVHAPSALPPTSEGNSYQLRWELRVPAQSQPIFSFESLRINGLTLAHTGAEVAIEMFNDFITVSTVLDKVYEKVELEIFNNTNCKIVSSNMVTVNKPVQVAGGVLYSSEIDPNNIAVSGGNPFKTQLDAYVLTWKYSNANSRSVARMPSELFIVNPSILSAMEDVKRLVMKARTTQFGFTDMVFDEATLMSWLRRARDLFNSAGGVLVEFSMTNATGGIREYWLRYAEVAMLRAQSLAEGEKAFNFAGSAIQLDVDKSQYYSGLADTLQQQLDADVKPFKQNLLKKGAVIGDGNMQYLAGSFAGASRLGIALTPSSQVGRYGGSWWAGR